jgi:type VI secretion system ImpC/EvpB family protein
MRYGWTDRGEMLTDQGRRVRLSYREGPDGPEKTLPFIIGLVGDYAPQAESGSDPVDEKPPRFLRLDDLDADLALSILKPSLLLRLADPDRADAPAFLVLLGFQRLADFEPQALALGAIAPPGLDNGMPLPLQADLVDRAVIAAWRAQVPERAGRTHDRFGDQVAAGLPPHLRTLVAERLKNLLPLLTGPTRDDDLLLRLAELDRRLGRMVTDLCDDPALRTLEASWRGIARLAQRFAGSEVELALLPMSESGLRADLDMVESHDDRSMESCHLYRQIHEGAYYGGRPYGLICLDMALGQEKADLHLLYKLARLGEMTSTPVIAAAAPQLMQLRDFAEVAQGADLRSRLMELRRDSGWRRLRARSASRFLALLLPGLLARGRDMTNRAAPRIFPTHNLPRSRPLWQHPVYVFAEVTGLAFIRHGWATNLTGLTAGRVVDTAPFPSSTGEAGRLVQPMTQFSATEEMEDAIVEAGLLPLCACQGRPFAAFFRANSLHRADGPDDHPPAQMMARLPLVLAVSHITHYLRLLGQQAIGQIGTASAVEHKLNQWLSRYVAHQDDAAPEIRARQPLRRGQVQIKPHPVRDDLFEMLVDIQPHFQFDEMDCAISLTAALDRGATTPTGGNLLETAHGA